MGANLAPLRLDYPIVLHGRCRGVVGALYGRKPCARFAPSWCPSSNQTNMNQYHSQYHRRSIRLQGYDYSQTGFYFITLCTRDRQCWFGEIKNGKMHLNSIGYIVAEEWLKSAEIRSEIELDEWIVMPNHFHGIVIIKTEIKNGLGEPFENHAGARKPRSLSTLISGFKAGVTKRINEIRQVSGVSIWQRNYYEHIIRDELSLYNIRKYILENPLSWWEDPENPQKSSHYQTIELDLPF